VNHKWEEKVSSQIMVSFDLRNSKSSPVLVAHACNPSYLGDWGQEDHSSKPAQANSYQDPVSKKNPE
jgi:hypothetical protein